MSILVENGADVNARDGVSFNLNEKDETDLSLYIKFSQRLGHTYAYNVFLVFLPVFLRISFRVVGLLYIFQLTLDLKERRS